MPRGLGIIPNGATGYLIVPRALRTSYIEKWSKSSEDVKRNADQLRGKLVSGVMRRRMHEYIPFTGETTGLIRDIIPAAEIIKRLVKETRECLDKAGQIGN